MKHTVLCGLLAGFLFAGAGPAFAQDAKPSGNPMAILKKMSDDLGAQKAFSLTATSVYDERFEQTLIKTVVVHRVDVVRPNIAYFDAVWDDGAKFIGHYDGSLLRIFEPDEKEYSEIPFEGTVSKMADFADAAGLTRTPLNDLLRDDFYGEIEAEIFDATLIDSYEGQAGENRNTSHLLLESPGASWQVWIAHGGSALPARYNVKYVRALGQPEYAITFDEWSFDVNPGSLAEKYGVPEDLSGWTRVEFENPIKNAE